MSERPPENIRRINRPDGIVELCFDRQDSGANVFDRATMGELELELQAIERSGGVKGVVVTSAKPKIFLAGADLEEMSALSDVEEISIAIEKGQRVFEHLAALPCVTVAAIHGACLGGGFELALACDWRVASDDRSTKIGLPEVLLGILPAWGGTTRLPRLVGLPTALPAMLTGRRHAAKLAKKRGLVDAVVPRERLIDVALARIAKGKPERKRIFLPHLRPVAGFIRKKALEQVQRETKGHYPAPAKIIEVATQGLETSIDGSLQLERAEACKLIQTDVSRNLIRIHFLQERSRKLRALPEDSTAKVTAPTSRMAVIGAGVMGAGIAQWSAGRGIDVILRDIDPQRVGAGLATIAKTFHDAVRRHKMDRVDARAAMDRILPSDIDVPLDRVDLVIEAAVESMDIKREIFADLDDRVREDTILATNTSSLSITELAKGLDRPERIVGIHFFNPVHRMQLVEVVRGEATSPEVVEGAVRYVHQIGKLPVVVADRPGFLVNRILMPYLFEAVHLFENGASVEAIDGAMEAFGMPMGPMRLLDEVGLDVAAHVGEYVGPIFGDRLPVSPFMERMKDAGWLGRKAGRGFYEYPKKRGKKKSSPKPHAAVSKFRAGNASASVPRDELARRMVLLMVNEAARCLEEKVVEDARDVDFAMIMGTGFAPFRGGPLMHVDTEGLSQARDYMRHLSNTVSARFEPCALLEDMAKNGRKFYSQGTGGAS